MPLQKLISNIVHRYCVTIKTAVLLIGQMNNGERANPVETVGLYKRLKDLIHQLMTSDTTLMSYAVSSEGGWRNWEYKAARWSLLQLIRKLYAAAKTYENLDEDEEMFSTSMTSTLFVPTLELEIEKDSVKSGNSAMLC